MNQQIKGIMGRAKVSAKRFLQRPPRQTEIDRMVEEAFKIPIIFIKEGKI